MILHHALYAAAVLGIADLLNEGPRPVAQLAKLSDVDEDALFRTLRYLSGLIDAGYPGQTPTLIRAQPHGAHKDASESERETPSLKVSGKLHGSTQCNAVQLLGFELSPVGERDQAGRRTRR